MSMRVAAFTLVAFVAVPVAAQTAPATPSVAGYLCTFAGKCDGVEPEQATRDAPETKGFRLARSGGGEEAEKPAAVRAGAARRSPRSAPTYRAPAARAAYSTGETRRANLGAAKAIAAPRTAPNGGARRRADLMIGFELNSDRLTTVGRESARVFAQSLLTPELRDKRFLIEGHTDESGGTGINMPLSTRRAQRVAEFLIGQGVEPSRLETQGYGSSAPLPGKSAASPANRRVEAELLS